MADLFSRLALVPIATTALDSIVNQLSKNVKLYYPSIMEPCPNCKYDPIGKKSSNYYKDGGPLPFANMTTCPMCDGVGMRASEVTETIPLLCEIVPQQFFLYPILRQQNIQVPDGTVEVKGYIGTQLSKFMRAEFYEIAPEQIGSFKTYRYKRMGEPIDGSNIVQGRYFVCLINRID